MSKADKYKSRRQKASEYIRRNNRVIFGSAAVGFLGATMVLIGITFAAPANEQTKQYPYHFIVTKTDLANATNKFEIRMEMWSETFSAQMPIRYDASIRQLEGNVSKAYLIFPRANFHEIQYDPLRPQKERFKEYNVDMERENYVDPLTDFAIGSTIRYEIQGCYNVEISTNQTVAESLNHYKPDSCSEINIGSLEVTKNNELSAANTRLENINTKLTVVILFLAVLDAVLAIREIWFVAEKK